MKLFSLRYSPLSIFILYTGFCFISLAGPVKYINMNYGAVILFCSLFLFLFSLGFIKGSSGSDYNSRCEIDASSLKIIELVIIAAMAISFVDIVKVLTSGKSLSIQSMGENYLSGYSGYVRGQASIGFSYVLNIFKQSIVTLSLLVAFAHYARLGKKYKYMALFIVATYVLVNVVSSGKQKYLGDIIIFTFYGYLCKYVSSGKKLESDKVVKLIILSVLSFFMFSYILSLRYSAVGINASNIASSIHPLNYWDENSIVIYILGDDFGFPLGAFLGYFSNGLYGLSVSLGLDFQWTYFVGHSYSLSRIIEAAVASPDLIISQTYSVRAQSAGWGIDKWHSAFTWFASDVSFPGVIVLGWVFGYFYGVAWKGSITNKNAFSRPMFLYLSLGVVFIFSNNQMFHSLSGVIVFYSLTFLLIIPKLLK